MDLDSVNEYLKTWRCRGGMGSVYVLIARLDPNNWSLVLQVLEN